MNHDKANGVRAGRFQLSSKGLARLLRLPEGVDVTYVTWDEDFRACNIFVEGDGLPMRSEGEGIARVDLVLKKEGTQHIISGFETKDQSG